MPLSRNCFRRPRITTSDSNINAVEIHAPRDMLTATPPSSINAE